MRCRGRRCCNEERILSLVDSCLSYSGLQHLKYLDYTLQFMWRVSSLLSGVDQACHAAGKLVFVILENNSPEQKTSNKNAWPVLAALHALHCGLA